MDHFFLGIDGGGTKCRARLVDPAGNVLGEAVTGLANINYEGGSIAYRETMASAWQAMEQAGLTEADASRVYCAMGLAGARMPRDRDLFSKRGFPFAQTTIRNDVDIACYGAHEGEDGAVIILGTGSAGLAQIGGRDVEVAGWGFFVSDLGSGAIMGRRLIRRSLEGHEGLLPETALTAAVMAKFDSDQEKLMIWGFEALPKDFGKFAPMVLEYLSQGDPVAKELYDIQMLEIDRIVSWLLKAGAPKLAFVGGLGTALLPDLKAKYGAIVIDAKADPVVGAIILAKREFSR